MIFEDVYGSWTGKRLSVDEAARLLGVCGRAFRRLVNRYEESGSDGLPDKRLSKASHRKAPVDETMEMIEKY